VIETERLILRQWREEDRAPWRAMNADAEVMRHFPAPLTAEQADAIMDRERDRIAVSGVGLWAVERRADGLFLGFVGLCPAGAALPLAGEWEVVWRLARHAWGQGYASEAARAALAHAFEGMGLERVVSFTATTNLASQAVMRRIGMVPVPAEDFDHPALPQGHPLRRHVVHEVRR
jgi:RimJ/RimL family protein N-acetyltransferase